MKVINLLDYFTMSDHFSMHDCVKKIMLYMLNAYNKIGTNKQNPVCYIKKGPQLWASPIMYFFP